MCKRMAAAGLWPRLMVAHGSRLLRLLTTCVPRLCNLCSLQWVCIMIGMLLLPCCCGWCRQGSALCWLPLLLKQPLSWPGQRLPAEQTGFAHVFIFFFVRQCCAQQCFLDLLVLNFCKSSCSVSVWGMKVGKPSAFSTHSVVSIFDNS